MRKSLTSLGPANRPSPTSTRFFVGAELDATQIRAAVFDVAGRLLGKAKRSAKLERGPTAVLQRVARCIRDAIDECDLTPADIPGAGLGVTDRIAQHWPASKMVGSGILPKQSWQKELADLLGFPVILEAEPQLSTFGIYTTELEKPVGIIAALFCGPELTGGMLVKGGIPADNTLAPLRLNLQAVQQQMQAELDHPEFCHWPKNKLRKAARRGDPQVQAFARKSAHFAGVAAAALLQSHKPDLIAFGGGLVDELKAELMPIILATARNAVKSDADFNAKTLISELGDSAVLVGGALLAHRRLTTL